MKNTVKRVLISMMALNLTFGGFASTKALAEELSNTDSEQIQVEETYEDVEVQDDTFEEYEEYEEEEEVVETVSNEKIQQIKQRRQFLINNGVNNRFQTKKFEVYENNGCVCNSILSIDDPITSVDSFGTHINYENHRFVNYYTYQGEYLVHITTCFDCLYSKVTEVPELPEGAQIVGEVPEEAKKETVEKAKETVIDSDKTEEKTEVAPIADNTEVENKVESDAIESNEETNIDDSDNNSLMMNFIVCTLIGAFTAGVILFILNHIKNNKKNDR